MEIIPLGCLDPVLKLAYNLWHGWD